MSETLKFGNGQWATKEGSTLAYNSENGNFKPLPFTFDRSTSATRVNKDGLIEVVSNNEPRIDFKDSADGSLLLEPTRSNLITYSEDFSDASWTKSNAAVTLSSELSPMGILNTYDVVYTSGGFLIESVSTTKTIGSSETISVFSKSDIVGKFLKFGGGTASGTDVEKKEDYGNGWFRYSVTRTFTEAETGSTQLIISSTDIGLNTTLFGAQLEQGSYATSYIPTQGSVGTRVAESCIQTNINTSIISSSYPFSMYVESTYIVGNEQPLSFINSNVANNYYVITINSNVVNLDARANGLTELISSGVSLVNGQKFKAAITMQSATSGKICVNGNTVISKTNFSNQSVNSNINDLLLGQLRTSLDTGNRLPITDARLYNQALTDQELINLTKI